MYSPILCAELCKNGSMCDAEERPTAVPKCIIIEQFQLLCFLPATVSYLQSILTVSLSTADPTISSISTLQILSA